MALDIQSILIDAPVDAVFGYLTDVARTPEWSSTVEYGLADLEVISQSPFGVGFRWRSRGRNVTGRLNEDESVVTAFQPPRSFGFSTRCALDGGLTTFRHRYDLMSENNGTRVTYTLISARPHNLKAVQLLVTFMLRHRNAGKETVAGGLAALKAAIERLPQPRAAAESASPAGFEPPTE
jgi:uncharacterized protein YndB with AHSA1/START domain